MPVARTGLLVRHDREAVTDGTGESHELDFDIPYGWAIEIHKILLETNAGDQDGAAITMDMLVDLDGPGLASNSLSTQALFEAREILDSCIASIHTKHDAVTSGAGLHSERQMFDFSDDPILTAKNPGTAFLSVGASGEGHITFYYKWVTVSQNEQVALFSTGRA